MIDRWEDATILFVSDAGATAAFYADKLGFTVNWRPGPSFWRGASRSKTAGGASG